MFNLLVSGSGWSEARDTMPFDRVLGYTDPHVKEQFLTTDGIDFNALISIPLRKLMATVIKLCLTGAY